MIEKVIFEHYLYSKNFFKIFFAGILSYHLHSGQLHRERVSPLRTFPLLHAGDRDTLA